MASIDPLDRADTEPAAPSAGELPIAASQAGADGEPSARDKQRRSPWRELPILIIVALIVAMVIKSFVVQAFIIPTGSMQNTLGLEDKILVNKLVYHVRAIQPGDIVVFDGSGSWNAPTPPSTDSGNVVARAYDDTLRKLFDSIGGLFGTPIGQTDYVKRVIAVPGDHVVCCNASGLITVNGVPLHEQSYLFPGDRPAIAPAGIPGRFNITVPAGYLWVLGDHRGISDDSRGHEADPGNGMIPEDKVIGRAFVVAWPPSQWRVLSIPATFKQPGIIKAAGAVGRSSAGPAAAALPGLAVHPAAPYLPTAAGFTASFPIWWLSRRARTRCALARRGRTRVTRLAA